MTETNAELVYIQQRSTKESPVVYTSSLKTICEAAMETEIVQCMKRGINAGDRK